MDVFQLPLGLGMALAQNEQAMARFDALSEADNKKAFVEKTHSVHSKSEMRSLVNSLTDSTGV